MIAFSLMFFVPILGMLFFAFFGQKRIAGVINIIFASLTFLVTVALGIGFFKNGPLLIWKNQFYVDAFGLILIILTAFVSLTVAIFSRNYMQHSLEQGRISPRLLQLYYLMFQAFTWTMLLVYSSNNIGLLWVSMEGATLTTVLLVSLYRTPESIEAAWKYFILCIVGIALALFGIVCVYFSSINLDLTSNQAMLWTVLHQYAANLDPKVLTIGFVFILVGYGTKIGLVPFHFWLPDAHSESPAPMSALLSGLLLNIGVYALVRFKMLVDPSVTSHLADHLMEGFGLLSFIVAGFFIYRQRNIKRMFSYSSIEHLGLITFAFGLNLPLTTFVALFYLIVHSLIKSSIFMSVGNVIQVTKSQDMGRIRGLIHAQPITGWLLLIGLIAIAGFPPFGIFNSEVLLMVAAVKTNFWLAILLLIGFLLAMAGLFKNLHPVLFGRVAEGDAALHSTKVSVVPSIFNLAVALVLGIHLPKVLMICLNQATTLITGGGI